MVELKKINKNEFPRPEVLESMRVTYLSSFPAEEQRPWASVMALGADAGSPYNIYMLYDDGQPVGFLTLWHFGELAYVEHLAVDAARRGRGYGHALLRLLGREIGDDVQVVVEVEPSDTSDEARRRIGFYQSLGFEDIADYPYVQPPYAAGLPEVPLMLMVKNAAKSPEPSRIEALLHKKVYNR